MPEMHDLDFDALFSQRNSHRREDESSRHLFGTTEKHFLQLRKSVEPHGLEKTLPFNVLVDVVRDWTGEMAGDRNETDAEFCFRAAGGHPAEPFQVEITVERSDQPQ